MGDAAGIDTADAVRNEKVRMLYKQSVPALFGNVSLAFMVSAGLWSSNRPAHLAAWLGLVVALTLARMELRRRYREARQDCSHLAVWGVRYAVGSTASGMVWGLAVIFFFENPSEVGRVLLTLTMGGLVAGAAGSMACYLPAYYGFLVPALMPLVVRNVRIGDSRHLIMATMLTVFAAVLTVVALNTHRALTEAFRLRFENERLLGRLSHAQRSLEETNRTLEKRVQERTAALEAQSEALREAQQLESVGRLAGGIAHDFNNLLTVVLANVTLMLRDPALSDGVRSALEEVEGAADRGAELVRQLLAFGRRQHLAPQVLDLNQVIATLERILVRLIGERVQIVFRPAPGRPLVSADRGQLEQVIINLVTNARDAMPAGGTLTIATTVVEAGGGDPLLAAGSYVVLSVSDTGSGMDAETRRRVFEPFFTTKELGKGTGLGLATVYGVVDQSGGHVLVESEPGAGSVFKVYLPRTTAREAAIEPAPSPGAVDAVGATILLAEDDIQVRRVMQRVLAEAGHQVLVAGSGEAALAQSRAHAGPIHVLITDVVMTNLGGPELARLLCAERPDLRVLFVSGYNQDDTFAFSDPAHRIEYLQKPLTFALLESKLATLLEGATTAGVPPRDGGRPGDVLGS